MKIRVKPLKTGFLVTKTVDGEEEQHGIQDFGQIARMLMQWLPRDKECEISLRIPGCGQPNK